MSNNDSSRERSNLSFRVRDAYGWSKAELARRARVHDNKTPVMAHDFESVVLRTGDRESPMQWYGGTLWRAELEAVGTVEAEVCATDVAGLDPETAWEGLVDLEYGYAPRRVRIPVRWTPGADEPGAVYLPWLGKNVESDG